MKVVKKVPKGKTEKLTKLGDVIPGSENVFRFQGTSAEEIFANEGDTSFYMVIKTTPEKAGRVTICSLDGMSVLERDVSHLVIIHPAEVAVGDAELI